ncbi:MAG: hypothetical protein H7122_00105 [Chitinophagaceae bacterium]|nr:hypothetical protein [Chitinophagaceae bacterium]
MKKWLIGLLLVIGLAVGSSYFFIPDRLKISKHVIINNNQQGVFRFLADEDNWEKWWPDNGATEASILKHGDFEFQIKQVLHNAFEINLASNNVNTSSLLQIFSHAIDSINIKWSAELIAGNNPLRRIQQYFAAQKLGLYFESILDHMKKHVSSLKNIYGIDIKKEKVQSQLLISSKKSFSHYPTTPEIYTLIDKLKNQVAKSDAKADSFPMLNIQRRDSSLYIAQVALAIDKRIPEENDISVKWMMKDGNILSGEVIGDNKKIEVSMKQFDKYISDYQRTVIAIPFQLMITDRLKQTDSTKWVTRIYYPVI